MDLFPIFQSVSVPSQLVPCNLIYHDEVSEQKTTKIVSCQNKVFVQFIGGNSTIIIINCNKNDDVFK